MQLNVTHDVKKKTKVKIIKLLIKYFLKVVTNKESFYEIIGTLNNIYSSETLNLSS